MTAPTDADVLLAALAAAPQTDLACFHTGTLTVADLRAALAAMPRPDTDAIITALAPAGKITADDMDAILAADRPGSERADALEEAAKIADDWCEKNRWPNGVWAIAAAIRSLKAKP